jgi:hypothetical protein
LGTNVLFDSCEIASLKRAPSASKSPLAFIASGRSRFDPTCLIADSQPFVQLLHAALW